MNRRRFFYWICSTLFLMSGCSGLMYEVIWFKRFSYVWGNSTLATASVVVSFLFGLGFGAYLIGRLADLFSQHLLFWFGVCECFIGIFAFLIPYEIHWLFWVVSFFYPIFQNYPVMHFFVRFAFTFLLIGPPCILMGGTLPLLIKQFTPPDSCLKEATGWLYAINTIGAASGCYLAGFHLLPSIGLYWSNVLAIIINLTIGIGAILIAKFAKVKILLQQSLSPDFVNPKPISSIQSIYPYSIRSLYITVAITGFASLALEMIWFRQLALILGGSTYAFSAVLFIFLIGIGIGSLCFHLWLRKLSNIVYAPALIIFGVILLTVIGYCSIPHLTCVVGLLKPLRSSQVSNALISVIASSVLLVLPTMGMGLLFPIFVHLTNMRSENAGKAVGNVYAWNTIGAITGASITYVFLVPRMGMPGTLSFVLFLYILALNLQFPGKKIQSLVLRILLIAFGSGAIFFAIEPQDPRITNSGMYLYGYSSPERLTSEHKILYFNEGPSCNVLVEESAKPEPGNIHLIVNGKTDASSAHPDMKMQLGLAYFPRLLKPKAQKVLNIGFGSGTTAGASLLFPDTKVTCCEIEPSVFATSKYFFKVNHKPEDSPHFKMILDDGRNYLMGAKEKYDMILSEPSNPWMAGISNLFTKEFYEVAKSRLSNDGVLAQWLQIYRLSPSEYALVVRTILSEFPHCVLIRISDGDTILLASAASLGVTEKTVRDSQALVNKEDAVKADLKEYFGTADVATLLLQHVILDREGLCRLIKKYDNPLINTDINMRLEYDAPLRLFKDRKVLEDTSRSLLEAADVRWFRDIFHRLGCSRSQIDAIYHLANLFEDENVKELSIQIIDFGLEVVTDEPRLVAMRQILDPPQDPKSFEKSLSSIATCSVKEINRLGVAMWKSKRYEEAALVFEKLLKNHPNSATSWTNLAVNYQLLGQRQKAEQAFKKAFSLDPHNDFTESSYNAFKKENSSSREQGEDRPTAQLQTATRNSIN